MTDLPAPDPFDDHAEPEVLTEALFGHRSWLRRLARALVRDDASADDLVQDAFGAAISAGGRVRNLRAFLSGTVRRRSLELRRNEARRRAREIDSSGDGPSAFPGADVAAERVETLRILLEELQLLPAAQRDALTMRFVEGLEPAEIARRADMAASTVRAHIARGLATLRERLDRRGGGRKSWSLALSPWAGLSAPDVAGETLAATSTSSAVPLGATGAIVSSGVALMTWKATAAVVPLALLGLWFGLDRGGDEGLSRTATRDAQEDDGTQTLANVATTEVERRAMLEAEPTSGRAASVEASIADITAPSVDDGSVLVTGSAVDILTGEPVPSIRLTVRSSRYTLPAGHPDVPNASDVSDAAEVSEEPTSTVLSAPASTSASQPPGVEVVTESDGTFTSEDTLPPGTVFVTENDSTDKWPGDTHFAQNSLPFTDPLPVHVGPTFRLVSAVPPGIPWDELRGRFAIGVDRGRRGMRAMVRGNDAPWIRLPYDVTRLGGDGPWTLELTDPEGLWLAEAEVTRKKGIEPHPVAMEFRSLGALEFVAACKPGALAPTGAVELVSESGAAVRRVYMDVAQDRTESAGRARFLEPGTYNWSRGPMGGEAKVRAGEVTRIALDYTAHTKTFDAQIRIDASALSDLDMSSHLFQIVDPQDLLRGFMQWPMRVEGDPPGWWRLELAALPEQRWNVVPMEGMGTIRWEPPLATVAIGETPPVFVARPPGERVGVRITAIDALSGEPLPDAEASLSTGGLSYIMLRADSAGQMNTMAIPSDTESHAFVRAPGYEAGSVRFVPDVDGTRFEVALERGWRGVVRVVRTEDFELVEGIEILVNGEGRGRTDENGLLWIEGEGPPSTLELGEGAEGMEVTLSPTDLLGPGLEAPLVGYTFVVKTR